MIQNSVKYKNQSCIYGLVCTPIQTIYIGQTKNLYRRLSEHLQDLKHDCAHTTKLQQAYNKYGIEQFELIVLEVVPEQELNSKEQEYIQRYLNHTDWNIFNTFSGGTQNYTVVDDEFRTKISKAHKGRKLTTEQRAQRARAATKQWTNTSYRQQMVESAKRQWQDPAYRQKMLEAQLNKHNCGQNKLTIDIVKHCRQQVQTNQQTVADLARQYGVHYATMYQAVTGATWKNI